MTQTYSVTRAEPIPVLPITTKYRSNESVRKSLPAVWMRAGTSKGLFLHRRHLPASKTLWEPILLSAMGSSKGSSRQIDGVGGASSTTSKVAIVERSNRPGVDVEYTFVQVAPDQPRIDVTGNCGNIASGVGPFALDEGLVNIPEGEKEVNIKILNTNTGQHIFETVQVATDGSFREDGDYAIPGVEGTASPIRVAFLKPCGSMTGQMFPSGMHQEMLTVQSRGFGTLAVRVSLVDAANPFVFVDAASLPVEASSSIADAADPVFLGLIEDIRRHGAVRFGLAENVQAAGQVRGTPKIAILSPATGDVDGVDIEVKAFSMGKPHASLQLTGAVCLGAATIIHGTIAWDLAHAKEGKEMPKHGMSLGDHQIAGAVPVGIRHPAGVIHTETVLGMDRHGAIDVDRVAVYRTARRLFEGRVFYRP
ncbi:PrpF family protein [Aspergillus niger]|uniref:PrpF family protein n=1 Tax=Aspergillus niger TaxID=5061 RepID=A0A505HRL3_ASPNG|nr:PrpF family protein [Aspergillus niger]